MGKIIETFSEMIKKVNDPAMITVIILWLSGIGVITVLITGCGALNYQPLEKTQITIENTEKENTK